MNRKYRLSSQFKTVRDGNFKKKNIYQIIAVRDFGNVKAGDIGGYVESENNLSHDGNCWIEDGANVYGNARVDGNAIVKKGANVYENAKITGNSTVAGKVFGHGKVSGGATVKSTGSVFGNARISEWAIIHGEVSGNTKVDGNTVIDGADIIMAVNV